MKKIYTKYEIYEAFKLSFSERLISLMKQNGFLSNRKPYLVDVNKFSQTLNISKVMLRRYLSGEALPQFSVIDSIAKFFNVDPLWLYSGIKNGSEVDIDLLKIILTKSLLKLDLGVKEIKIIVEQICDIYEHVSAIDNTQIMEKHRLVDWMLDKTLNIETATKAKAI